MSTERQSPPTSQAPQREAERKPLLRRMVRFLAPVKWHTALALTIFLASIAAEVWSVYLLRAPINIIAQFTSDGGADQGSWRALLFGTGPAEQMRWAILWVVIAYAVRSVLVWGRHVAFSWQNMTTISHMRAGVYDRLQRVGMAFFDRYSTGQLINRAISDLKNVRQFLVVGLRAAVDVTFTCVGYLIMLGLCSPYLAVAALLPLPFWIWALRSYARRSQPLIRAQTRASDEVLRVVTENVAGAHVVRAFAAEDIEQEKFDTVNARLFDRLLALVGLQQKMLPLLRGIVALAQVSLFTAGAILVQQGYLQLGDLVIFGVAIAAILAKLQQLNVITEAYQKAIVSCTRLFEILDSTDTTPQLTGATRLRRGPGQVEFRQVTFGYLPEEAILTDVSAEIPAGQFVTIVGPPGSGKSTLAAMIGRCYDPWSGEVLIDDQDVRTATPRSVHEEVAYVFQDSYLFNDSVARNISYGDVTAPMADIKEAARVAGAHDFIEQLPEGYNTLLGENGLGLSGGQRQRLALARAILRESRILVLDDALSAVDAATEADILYRLNRYLANQTLVMITSRIATCRESDGVLVIEDGRITQRGTHDELVSVAGYYRQTAGTLFGVSGEAPATEVSHLKRMLVETPAFGPPAEAEPENGGNGP